MGHKFFLCNDRRESKKFKLSEFFTGASVASGKVFETKWCALEYAQTTLDMYGKDTLCKSVTYWIRQNGVANPTVAWVEEVAVDLAQVKREDWG